MSIVKESTNRTKMFDITTSRFSMSKTAQGKRQINMPITRELEDAFNAINEEITNKKINSIIKESCDTDLNTLAFSLDKIRKKENIYFRNVILEEKNSESLLEVKNILFTLGNVSGFVYEILLDYANRKAGIESETNLIILEETNPITEKEAYSLIAIHAIKLIHFTQNIGVTKVVKDLGEYINFFTFLRERRVSKNKIEKFLLKLNKYTNSAISFDALERKLTLKTDIETLVYSVADYQKFLDYRPTKVEVL
ncbi:hypothetical protein MA785_000826 [Vibrio parahaemolyticus]|nr:hypothetical protein [Vibrio parahaemolyticus]EJR2787935.1 hypothetical protein [Vibrio parahaemolyticus]